MTKPQAHSSSPQHLLTQYYPTKRFLILETLLFIIFPIVLTKIFPQLILIRHLLLLFGGIYLYAIAKTLNYNIHDIGLSSKNLSPSLKSIIKPTMIVWTLFLYIAIQYSDYLILNEARLGPTLSIPLRLLFYVFFSVPLQELVFRGFVIKRLSLLSQNTAFITMYTSVIFAFVHLMFSNYWIAVITFLVSLYWTKNYLKYQSLWSIIFSHAVLGSLLIFTTF